MDVTNVSRAKRDLSELLRRVENGETILIVRRGKPIARLAPAVGTGDQDDQLLGRLEREGIVRRATVAPDPALLDGPAPQLAPEESLLGAILADRDEGR